VPSRISGGAKPLAALPTWLSSTGDTCARGAGPAGGAAPRCPNGPVVPASAARAEPGGRTAVTRIRSGERSWLRCQALAAAVTGRPASRQPGSPPLSGRAEKPRARSSRTASGRTRSSGRGSRRRCRCRRGSRRAGRRAPLGQAGGREVLHLAGERGDAGVREAVVHLDPVTAGGDQPGGGQYPQLGDDVQPAAGRTGRGHVHLPAAGQPGFLLRLLRPARRGQPPRAPRRSPAPRSRRPHSAPWQAGAAG
jgi:hypothetical protein